MSSFRDGLVSQLNYNRLSLALHSFYSLVQDVLYSYIFTGLQVVLDVETHPEYNKSRYPGVRDSLSVFPTFHKMEPGSNE